MPFGQSVNGATHDARSDPVGVAGTDGVIHDGRAGCGRAAGAVGLSSPIPSCRTRGRPRTRRQAGSVKLEICRAVAKSAEPECGLTVTRLIRMTRSGERYDPPRSISRAASVRSTRTPSFVWRSSRKFRSTSATLLAEIAREDDDPRVRRAAVAKLMDPAALASRRRAATPTESCATQALWHAAGHRARRVRGRRRSRQPGSRRGADRPKALAASPRPRFAKRWRSARSAASATRTRSAPSRGTRARADPARGAGRAHDRGEILNVALNSEFKDTARGRRRAADERADLEAGESARQEQVAAKRARAVLREMDERAAAAAEAAEPQELEAARIEQEERDRPASGA